ncbi:MAG: long-chain fatty acid--CoA ligase [Clostridia bacterium]|nr:long-chain fatty acid--CoA ligase [Clostridia bacterium]
MCRVAIIGENSIGYIDTLIKIWNNGDCAVLIDWRIPADTALAMMEEAGVKKCYIEKAYYEAFSIASTSVSFFTFERLNEAPALLPDNIYSSFHKKNTREEAVIIYSSGTTGKSKGIILSHFAINTNAEAIIDYMKPDPSDCIYICKTISHSSTLVGELLVALKTGMKLVIGPIIVPPRYVFKYIALFGVTLICVNPTLLSMFADAYDEAKYDLSSVRTIYVSGSILNDKTYEKAHDVFSNIPIYNVYGLSELGPRVSAQRPECCKTNSVGKPVKGVAIKIFDEQGKETPRGVYGVLHVQSPCQFEGYAVGTWKYASLCENWFNTGDIGFIDEFDELHIVGRIDDVIIIDSHKIYPGDVETIITDNTSVKECIVVKVDISGRERIGCLYVDEKDIGPKDKQILRSKLMSYEIPYIFVRCASLPRNRNGKIIISEVIDHIVNDSKPGGKTQ